MSDKNRVNLDDGFYLVRSGEASARLPSEVVVSRTDLEWALRLIENVHTVIWPNAKDVPYVEFDRLRAVLNTENQT